MYLNAVGYNYLHDGKINEALDIFELAMTLYPSSVNTYDSFGEALIRAGQKEKALKIYTEGYLLAKRTGDKNLSYIEANLKRLKEDLPIDTRLNSPPSPPIPQPQ
jgi:tetratricopeptide (TPR) repeat protein